MTMPRHRRLRADRLVLFPRLSRRNHTVTSNETDEYNCVAWAAGDDENWWWPLPDYYWPSGIPRESTLSAFAQAYQTLGYEVCVDDSIEQGFEKIAIYALPDTPPTPTHVARQLPNGRWTSKLGSWEDIEHREPGSLEGITHQYAYGYAQTFMRRTRR